MSKKIEGRDEMVVNLYCNHKQSCSEIAHTLNVQHRTIYKILLRNNISLRENVRLNTTCALCNNSISKHFKNKNTTLCGSCTTAVRRYRVKKFAVEYKGSKCNKCGWSGDISCFDFHHKDPTLKEFTLQANNMSSTSWEKIKAELDKCVLVCSNCHRTIHSNYSKKDFLYYVEHYKGNLFSKKE